MNLAVSFKARNAKIEICVASATPEFMEIFHLSLTRQVRSF